jgi:uncharacterized protein
MLSPTEHFAARLLRRLANAIYRHPRWFLYPQFVVAGFCIWYTAFSPWHLRFDMSRDNLVGGHKKYHQNFLNFKKEFPLQDDLVVVVESEDKEKNRQFVERLGARLEEETNLFTEVMYKGDLKMLGKKALLFLPEAELEDLHRTLQDYRPFLDQFVQATNLLSFLGLVNNQFLHARREANADNDAMIKALPAFQHVLSQAADSLKRTGNPPSPGIDALFGGGEEAEGKMYITHGQGRIYLVTARARAQDLNEKAVLKLRQLVAQTQQEVSGLNVGITGEPVLEIDEMAQSEKDTTLATVISFFLVLLIIIYGYGEVTRRLKADVCLLVGLAFTMAFTTLTVGHLNILTVTFAPILIGLAIDFGVHFIARFEEELHQGRSEKDALETAMVFTGLGIFTGCLTTAGAFFAMCATNFKGIQEMGIICGGGLVICLVPMMVLLPAMLVGGRPHAIDQKFSRSLDRREKIESLWLGRPRLVIIITLAICLGAAITARKVYFDYDLLHMQSAGLPAVVYEKKLINSANKSVLFGALMANSLEEAMALQARLTNLSTVVSADLGGIENMGQYLTEDQTHKLALVKAIKQELAPIRVLAPDPQPADVKELSRALWVLYGYLSLALPEVEKDDPALFKQLGVLRDTVSQLREEMYLANSSTVARQLGAFQRALFNDVRETFLAMQTQDADSRLTAADLPPSLRHRFQGVTGKYLIQAYPAKDVWQRKAQKEFVQQLRTVDPNVTGTPVQLYEYTSLLKNSYEEAALYSLIAIAILVMIHFHNPLCVLLALLPVGIGSLWMTGIMGLFEIPFNPANIMTLSLVIGVGVTNGIHILNRFAEEKQPTILAKSTGKAVLISALTTIAGFGSLMLAKHRGIASLGSIMAVGTATCMLAALTFLPALLNLLGQRGWGIKKPSGDNALSPAGSGGTEVQIPQLPTKFSQMAKTCQFQSFER